MELWIAFVGGGAGAAVVSIIGQLIIARQARRYAQEDKETKELKELRSGMKWLLYDRIRFLGMHYIADGRVDFDDLRILREMHTVYNGLGGNGDLQKIMREVDGLPLKGVTNG